MNQIARHIINGHRESAKIAIQDFIFRTCVKPGTQEEIRDLQSQQQVITGIMTETTLARTIPDDLRARTGKIITIKETAKIQEIITDHTLLTDRTDHTDQTLLIDRTLHIDQIMTDTEVAAQITETILMDDDSTEGKVPQGTKENHTVQIASPIITEEMIDVHLVHLVTEIVTDHSVHQVTETDIDQIQKTCELRHGKNNTCHIHRNI
jgi:hypothetical protein